MWSLPARVGGAGRRFAPVAVGVRHEPAAHHRIDLFHALWRVIADVFEGFNAFFSRFQILWWRFKHDFGLARFLAPLDAGFAGAESRSDFSGETDSPRAIGVGVSRHKVGAPTHLTTADGRDEADGNLRVH